MLTRIALWILLVTFGLALRLDAQPQPAQAPPPIKRTIMQRADVPGTDRELIYAVVDIAAGAKAGRHTHPGVAMAYIVEGDFWLHLDGQPERVLHPGDSAVTPNRAVHNEGALDKPVKLIAVYVVEKGQPLATPAP